MMKFMLLAAIAVSAAASAQAPSELRFGSEPWRLALSLDGFKAYEGVPSTADRQVYSYSNGLRVISVIVENAHAPATLASCRDVFAQRKQKSVQGIFPTNETQGQRGDGATQEYDLELNFQGKAIVQHNAFACRVRGNYYIDVHASKMDYR